MGTCIFCGAVGKLTREHIWADWLKKYIPKDEPSYTANRRTIWPGGAVTDHGVRVVGGDVRSRRVECVCGSRTYLAGSGRKGCNDGWMGKLQERVKPIALSLINGSPTKLRESQQKTLAAWIAMAIMCSEFGRDDSQTISQEDRTILYKHHVPPKKNWKIWIGDYDRQKWVPHWTRDVLTITKEKTSETAFVVRPPLNTQSTTYTVGRLYVHCVSSVWPRVVSGFDFPLDDRKLLRRIWPTKDAIVAWPPGRTMSDRDADRIASTFFLLLTRADKGG